MDATFHVDGAVFNYRVAGVLIENDHVLIHKQVNDKYWALPGGRVEVLEDSHTSIQREMKEELGVSVKVNRLLWITENFFEYNDKNFHEIGLYYLISSNEDVDYVNNSDFYGSEGERLIYRWVPIKELAGIPLRPEFLKAGLNDMPIGPQHLIVGK